MPKEPSQSFYNHNARPATARQLGTSTIRTGGTILSYISSNVFVKPPLVGHTDVYYAIDFDDLPGPDNIIPDDPVEEEETGQSTVITGTNVQVVPPAKRYHNSDEPLETWVKYRDEYLDECMSLEGRGHFPQKCAGCRALFPAYRCRDCTHGALWCQKCLLVRHHEAPLHNVQMWNGLFFQRSTLKELGLRVQLGHSPGQFCPTREPACKDFVVIHTNGIHLVNVDYCRCNSLPHRTQLLRTAWWPATPIEPKTCATMEVLRHFQHLNLQGKLTGYSFYRSLEYETDNTGLEKPPNRLASFMLMVRQFRHTKMLKRGGRAYDPGGAMKTAPGSLAIPCRACPIPNINLPAGWENVPPARAWLYMLIIAMDANFRLRSKLRGAVNKNHTLGPGWSYFVNNGPYSDFIKDYVDQEEIGTCVGFQALLNMLTKKSKGLRATGMAAVSCARHQMFRPLGLGDLQKGERQCNMDYLFTSSLTGVGIRMLTISYDVACQWFTNFWTRMAHLPDALKLSLPTSAVRALVPKFHLQSHEEKCHSAFSFNYCKGCGRAEGEGVERNWDELNGQAPSTAEMVPGHRWETLNDCCGWANFRKTMGLGNLLLKRLLLAIPQAEQTRRDFVMFDASLRVDIPAEVVEMERELAAWEANRDRQISDKSQQDPYRIPKSNLTLAQVRLTMAEEEKERAEAGTGALHDVSASAFLLLGMEIQNIQQTLRSEVSGQRKQTILQTTSLVERRTVLLKRIQRFREIQRIHMPGFDSRNHRHSLPSAARNDTTPTAVEDVCLFLPSELNDYDRRRYCPAGLASLENRLRYAEATDALEDLRHHLRTRSFTNRFKVANVTGQINNTRSRETQNRIDDKVRQSQIQYCRARIALLALRGKGEWEQVLQVLERSDVRALNERQMTQQEKDDIERVRLRAGVNADDIEDERVVATVAAVGEGQRRPSWIWFSGNKHENMDDPLTRKALRVEWAKAKARADRWEEEVVLLNEEMRRTLEFCSWKANWWETQITQRESSLLPDDPLAGGLKAYAHQQAALEREIATNWAFKWRRTRNRAIPIVSAVMGDGWVVHDDGEMMSIDDLANDLIELELDDDEAVGSDCED